MKVGFTGTRKGMNDHQKDGVRRLLIDLGATEGHHGDCEGADEEFHSICVELGIRTVGHPPMIQTFRAFCEVDDVFPPRDYLVRNRNIVRNVEQIIGAPKDQVAPHSLRGQGTWSTIKYSRERAKKPTHIVYPGGSIVSHVWEEES